MKSKYNAPQIEVTEIQTPKVMTGSVSFGDTLPGGGNENSFSDSYRDLDWLED